MFKRPIESWHNMNSNAHSSPFHRQPYHPQFGSQSPRPFVQEDTLKSEQIHIERKSFLLTLKENPRGRFLRISEEVNGKRNAIIIPATGLAEFKKLLDEMLRIDDEIAAKREPATLSESSSLAPVTEKPVKRTMSESARAKISAAVKARWAKIKSAGK